MKKDLAAILPAITASTDQIVNRLVETLAQTAHGHIRRAARCHERLTVQRSGEHRPHGHGQTVQSWDT